MDKTPVLNKRNTGGLLRVTDEEWEQMAGVRPQLEGILAATPFRTQTPVDNAFGLDGPNASTPAQATPSGTWDFAAPRFVDLEAEANADANTSGWFGRQTQRDMPCTETLIDRLVL
jgi:hypothetical protein